MKVIEPSWLDRLVEQAVQPDAGVVGGQLLYEDGTIQHAGVVIGMGGWADHVFKGMQPIHQGTPFISPMVTRNVTACTGACMAVSYTHLDVYKRQGYDDAVLEKLHRVQLEILSDFIGVCKKYNLTYFVVYGTAIGAVRHSGFIPWDDDIDVGMLREDYNKFFEVFQDELGEKYNLLTPEIDGRYACTDVYKRQRDGRVLAEPGIIWTERMKHIQDVWQRMRRKSLAMRLISLLLAD